MTTRHRTTSVLLVLPALLLLAPCAGGQTSGTTPAPASADGPTVIVNGTRQNGNDPHAINAAKDRILNGRSGSSCAFLDPQNPHYDPVMTSYMHDFGMDDSISNDVDHTTDYAPNGDVSNIVDSSSIDSAADSLGSLPSTATAGCGDGDRRFAAGRQHIVNNDKSLALAFEAYDNKNYPRAFELFTTAWNKVGYDGAGLMLARMSLYGIGTPKDTAKGIALLEKVTQQPFDPADRLRFNPAQPQAMNERIEAAFMLARIYERGLGVARDQHKADEWYARAFDFGFVPALDIMGERGLAGVDGQKDPAKAVAYLKDAADAGYAPAQFHLARAYYEGQGVPHDLKMAGAYFDAAARAGIPAAIFAAGHMYDMGEGVPADSKKAIVYYKDAALKGDRDAQFALGTYFYSGEVVGKNLATARLWFGQAARRGQPDAMFNLGAMAMNGEGGARDAAVAYVWFALAAESGNEQAGAALKMLGPKLTADERKRADTVLKPKLAKAQ